MVLALTNESLPSQQNQDDDNQKDEDKGGEKKNEKKDEEKDDKVDEDKKDDAAEEKTSDKIDETTLNQNQDENSKDQALLEALAMAEKRVKQKTNSNIPTQQYKRKKVNKK
ncbi:hypothetical protein ACLB2K_050806 [Fragaria x ananassa]